MDNIPDIIIDHQVIFAPYAVAEDKDTLDGIASSNEAEIRSTCSD